MDYKKKYEEALDNFKKIKAANKDNKELVDFIEYEYPELKESDDERIRKEIKEFILWTINRGSITGWQKEKSNSWIAWLEKQGEQKSEAIFLKFRIGDKVTNGEDTYTIDSIDKDCYWVKEHDCMTIPFEYQHHWELVGQKPTDKVEPKFKVKYAGNEYSVFEVKDIAGVTYYGIEDEPNHIDYVLPENCEIVSGYAIKENGSPYPTKPAVFSEQKPTWSEGDELMKQNCHQMLALLRPNSSELIKDIIDNCHHWLKSLKERMKGEMTR